MRAHGFEAKTRVSGWTDYMWLWEVGVVANSNAAKVCKQPRIGLHFRDCNEAVVGSLWSNQH